MSCIDNNSDYKGYIGVFDSGVGGISVLQALVKELPDEDFLFFGDSANAPYGEKTLDEIRKLSMSCADRLAGAGVKAIVVACNTATSAAIRPMRDKYGRRMPVIGVEPALKPAAEHEHHGRILVMATPATLHLEKYEMLSEKLAGEAEFIPVECRGLAARIEKGDFDAPDLHALLEKLIGPYRGKIDGIVLGCTHYPFIKKQIRAVMGEVELFDGGEGTARELRRQLARWNRLKKSSSGHVVFSSSLDTPEEMRLYHWLFRQSTE